MDYHEKLKALYDAGVELENKKSSTVNAAYAELTKPDMAIVEPVKTGKTRTFTYVGGGADSPGIIKFMGRLDFVRGTPKELPADHPLIKHIETCPTFREGKVSLEDLQDMDTEAKSAEVIQRKVDEEVNKRAQKALGK